MEGFHPELYEPAFLELLRERRLPPLGPGLPNRDRYTHLKALTIESAFAGAVEDFDMAKACLAGLWLYHDYLDESHTLSQTLPSPSGSFWHGIMHRREPDAANAAYWFRRVGAHPVFGELLGEVQRLAQDSPTRTAERLRRRDRWDPFLFIDLCEEHRDQGSDDEALCREIQQREWERLFDFCHRKALGR